MTLADYSVMSDRERNRALDRELVAALNEYSRRQFRRGLVRVLLTWAAVVALAVTVLLLAGCGDDKAPDALIEGSHVIALSYSDGRTEDATGWCSGKPAAAYAGDADGTEAHLAQFLAPFDAAVTEAADDPLVRVVVHGGGSEQCVKPGLLGLSYVCPGRGAPGDVWSTGDAALDAGVIAHELGHAIGCLQHTESGIMFPDGAPPVDGYEDVDLPNDVGGTQNAYRWMLRRLGGRL